MTIFEFEGTWYNPMHVVAVERYDIDADIFAVILTHTGGLIKAMHEDLDNDSYSPYELFRYKTAELCTQAHNTFINRWQGAME